MSQKQTYYRSLTDGVTCNTTGVKSASQANITPAVEILFIDQYKLERQLLLVPNCHQVHVCAGIIMDYFCLKHVRAHYVEVGIGWETVESLQSLNNVNFHVRCGTI